MPITFQGATADSCCRPAQPSLRCPALLGVTAVGAFSAIICAEACDFPCGTGLSGFNLVGGNAYTFDLTLDRDPSDCAAAVVQCVGGVDDCDPCVDEVETLGATVVSFPGGNVVRVNFTAPINVGSDTLLAIRITCGPCLLCCSMRVLGSIG